MSTVVIQPGQQTAEGFLASIFSPVIKHVHETREFGDVQYALVTLSNGHVALIRADQTKEGAAAMWKVGRVQSQKRWVNDSIKFSIQMPVIESADRHKIVLKTFHRDEDELYEQRVTLGAALGGSETDSVLHLE